MLLQDIHIMSVTHKKLRFNIIDPLKSSADHGFMNEPVSYCVLVLGATGTEPVSFAEFAAETAPAWKQR
jgi:hypothetical protein